MKLHRLHYEVGRDEAVEHTRNNRKRLKRASCLIELAKQAAMRIPNRRLRTLLDDAQAVSVCLKKKCTMTRTTNQFQICPVATGQLIHPVYGASPVASARRSFT